MIDWNHYLDLVCDEEEYLRREQVFTPLDTQGSSTRTELDLLVQAFRESEALEGEKDGRQEKERERFDALDGLRKFAREHVLLRGRPGSGKTTIFMKLLIEEAKRARDDPQARIPVLVSLRRFRSSAVDLVRQSLQRFRVQVGTEQLELFLNQGRLLLLFDGINELPSEEARRELELFRLDYGHSTPMVFTTRDVGLGGDLGIGKKLEIVPLSPKQIKSFVHAYIVDHEEANRMLRSLKDRMLELARTPLLLWMLCSVYVNRKKIPDRLGHILRIFTKTYEYAVKKEARVSAESRGWWPRLLAKLAYDMMRSGQQPTEMALVIHRNEAEKIFGEYLNEQGKDQPIPKAAQFLDDLINHHLLKENGSGGIEFLHQLIQEYYAAEHLLTRLADITPKNFKCDYLNYLKWTEPIAMMMEFLDKEDQAIQYVRLALDVDSVLGSRLAGQVKAEFQEKALLLVYRRQESLALQIKLLGLTKSEIATGLIRQFVDHEDEKIRKFAANALGRIGSHEAIEVLIKGLADEKIKQVSAEALGEIGTDPTVKQLIKALEDKDPNIRSGAALALGKIASHDALKHLTKALGDEDGFVRQNAIDALGEIGTDAAVRPLIRALKDNFALNGLKAGQALGKIGGDNVARSLLKPLGDYDKASYWAVNSAGMIGSDTVVEPLIRRLEHEEKGGRALVIKALGKITTDAAVKQLIKALGHKHPKVRSGAASALGNIGSRTFIKQLAKVLADEDSLVREVAARALGEIGSDEAVEHLEKILVDKDSSVRCAAAEAIAKIGGHEATKHLTKTLGDEDHSKIAYELAKVGDAKALRHLIKSLGDEDWSVRWHTAIRLGEIGNIKAFSYLTKALGDQKSLVREAAAEALGKIGGDKAVKNLAEAFQDNDPAVRRKAAQAIAKIGGEDATEFVIRAIEDGLVPTRVLYYSGWQEFRLDPKALPRLYKLAQTDPIITNAIAVIQERCRYYNPALIPIDRRFFIIHLSDLHFGEVAKADDLYVQLLLELQNDLGLSTIDALIISGDLVNRCTGQGYSQAQTFLSKILKRFSLTPDKVLIVPGNHDVDRDVSEAAYVVRRKEANEEIDEHRHIDGGRYIEVRDETEYKERFASFRTFYEKAFDTSFPTEYSDQVMGSIYPDQKVLIAGLNSAWELDHHYFWRSGLHPHALNQIIKIAAEAEYDDWLKIAVWHHPIKSNDAEETKSNKSFIRDHGFMERLAVAGFNMILHGHAHAGTARPFAVDTGKRKYALHVVAAGTLDADEDELNPGSFWQYNIIKVTGSKVSVECRKRVNPRGISRPDRTWLKAAPDKSTYEFDISDEPE